MSKEYIEKEAAINYLTANMSWFDEEGWLIDDEDERRVIIADLVDGIPPADVKPVVRGEWIDAEIIRDDGFALPVQACNQCKTFYPLAYTGGGHNFCPNCGADMKGKLHE